ncbi:MAG: uracil-DNA glycosylase [Ardenticatenaceae bacterium]|nr:uracil-DNA glycosylase [Ardenticatenaceae bacterium]HBY92470.1 uracil-DNA glycosylase [Chloroflexota bacterium]
MSAVEAIAALRDETVAALTLTLDQDQIQVVFGVGDPTSPLMIVGEAPGPQEARQGEPFVGPSGALLNETLGELGVSRDQVWISNVVKVWPLTRSGRSVRTRPPTAAEQRASWPFFERELEIVHPRVLVLLGGTAARAILGKNFKITAGRGQWRDGPRGIPTLATFHPSYVLRLQGMDAARGDEVLAQFKQDLRRAVERAGFGGGGTKEE